MYNAALLHDLLAAVGKTSNVGKRKKRYCGSHDSTGYWTAAEMDSHTVQIQIVIAIDSTPLIAYA